MWKCQTSLYLIPGLLRSPYEDHWYHAHLIPSEKTEILCVIITNPPCNSLLKLLNIIFMSSFSFSFPDLKKTQTHGPFPLNLMCP